MAARVLIAEDEANISESLSFILSREGHAVSTVADGEAVLQQLRRGLPDLLILDVMLPGRNGFEVLKAIKADARLQSLPVIVLTAKTQQRDREMAEAIGAAAYLTKPFANRDLVEQVRRLTRA
ncbi:response regulator transcription factor [Ramlibacter sp.]|uniref:response regulator transcription factor n=1 Tax=Ramlibacter sp. TaxID=1917967 RepID=UPI002FC69057